MTTNTVPHLRFKTADSHRIWGWCQLDSVHWPINFFFFFFLFLHYWLPFPLFSLWLVSYFLIGAIYRFIWYHVSLFAHSFSLFPPLSLSYNMFPFVSTLLHRTSPLNLPFSVATLGGGTGCVGESVEQVSSPRFSIGWSSSWSSSTPWPSHLNITSSLSG